MTARLIDPQPPPGAAGVETWEFQGRRSGERWRVELRASWEVALDAISEDFEPQTMTAAALMKLWIGRVRARAFPGGLVPIYWYVDNEDARVYEVLPGQYEHYPGQAREDFLTFFTWPEQPDAKRRLRWLDLPVRDKRWDARRGDKGGFIQEATGWKPGILQPFAQVESLAAAIVWPS